MASPAGLVQLSAWRSIVKSFLENDRCGLVWARSRSGSVRPRRTAGGSGLPCRRRWPSSRIRGHPCCTRSRIPAPRPPGCWGCCRAVPPRPEPPPPPVLAVDPIHQRDRKVAPPAALCPVPAPASLPALQPRPDLLARVEDDGSSGRGGPRPATTPCGVHWRYSTGA